MGKLPDTATAVSQRVAREESMALFLDEARNLSKEDQSLLMYRGLERLSHKDVAAILGIELETAKKRWQRLSQRLLTLPLSADFLNLES
jgi:DNA-directed RNA polymerase specialized sigma24 family protein